jgi:hypothetical protein
MKGHERRVDEPEPPAVQVCPQCRKVTGHRLPGWSSEATGTPCYACSTCRSVWRVTDTEIVMLFGVANVHANNADSHNRSG